MTTLPCTVSGDADKPALLLLHGFLSSNLQWAPNRERLLECFRLIEVELWGHGEAPAPEEPASYTIGRYADEFERMRADLGVEEEVGQLGPPLVGRLHEGEDARADDAAALPDGGELGEVQPPAALLGRGAQLRHALRVAAQLAAEIARLHIFRECILQA